ncbi:hypothetical protein C8248_06975 [Paracidovorax avenae]|nr:hypothetical protein C8236_07610 [Paracidovorax avenae]AVT05743.1 hypothetical protein C8248_06975 [Paracidovorax avenae]
MATLLWKPRSSHQMPIHIAEVHQPQFGALQTMMRSIPVHSAVEPEYPAVSCCMIRGQHFEGGDT